MSFKHDQITKIEPVGSIPYIGKGLQIHHTLNPNEYPSKVIFWYFANDSKNLVDELRQWGYGAV